MAPAASAPTGVVVFSQAASPATTPAPATAPDGPAGELAPADTGSILGMRASAPLSARSLAGRSLRLATKSVSKGRKRASRKSSLGVVTWFSSAPSTKFVIISAVATGSGSPALWTRWLKPSM